MDLQEARLSLYSKGSYTKAKNAIIRTLLGADFYITDRRYIGFETDTGYHHYVIQSTLTDCSGLDAEIESLLEEIDVVTELTKRCIAENSQTAQNQEEYAARYNGFVERYEKAKSRVEGVCPKFCVNTASCAK